MLLFFFFEKNIYKEITITITYRKKNTDNAIINSRKKTDPIFKILKKIMWLVKLSNSLKKIQSLLNIKFVLTIETVVNMLNRNTRFNNLKEHKYFKKVMFI